MSRYWVQKSVFFWVLYLHQQILWFSHTWDASWRSWQNFLKFIHGVLTSLMCKHQWCEDTQSDLQWPPKAPQWTPKGDKWCPMMPKKRPNGSPKVTNGNRMAVQGHPREPEGPQRPPKTSQKSPMKHKTQYYGSVTIVNVPSGCTPPRISQTTNIKQRTTNNKSLNP